jgi:hypothetical protein
MDVPGPPPVLLEELLQPAVKTSTSINITMRFMLLSFKFQPRNHGIGYRSVQRTKSQRNQIILRGGPGIVHATEIVPRKWARVGQFFCHLQD